MKVTLTPSSLEALEECGLCNIEEDESEFLHPYFTPNSHMALCDWNATNNMSPVVLELIMLVKAMCNMQSITHANGIVKYILKFIAKFDVANRVIALANARTGSTKVESEFLLNTNITSSHINKNNAFQQRRDKYHPTFCDIPFLEMIQLMLNIPEVATSLWFIHISTLLFEVRQRHKIKLNSKGDVIHNSSTNGNSDDDDDT